MNIRFFFGTARRSILLSSVVAAVLLCLLVLPPVTAEICPEATPCLSHTDAVGENETICIYYFYGIGCPHCERVKPLIDELDKKYPQVVFRTYEIYFNTSNQAMFYEFNQRYGITDHGVPTLFIGDRALVGDVAIKNELEGRIRWSTDHPVVCPSTYTKSGGLPFHISPAEPVDLTVPAIILAAIIDSINPCAFAVLIFLLAYLTSLGERRRVLAVGITYIATVFTVYFIAGLGLLTVVQQLGFTGIVFTIAAVIAIVAGLINIAEVLVKREIFTLAIPASKKAAIDEYVKRASVPSAILLGGLVSMVELPCTGGVYLAILGLIGNRMTLVEGIPYLLLYNLIFVLPLILILLVVYWGGTAENIEIYRTGSRRWVRLLIGVLLVALGAAMLLGIV
jgi:cytochrome c biogenesis protein CcdA/thiol-disulfide isomerase/thioredoxin